MWTLLLSMAAVTQNDEMARYSTAGHQKSDGLTVTLKYPSRWTPLEGERSHIVQKFVMRGTGENCSLGIRNLGERTAKIKAQGVLQEIAEGAVEDGWTRIEQKVTTIDSLPALATLYAKRVSSGGLEANMMMLQTNALYDADLISLTCGKSVTGNETPQSLGESIMLYGLIANSMVVHNQWVAPNTRK